MELTVEIPNKVYDKLNRAVGRGHIKDHIVIALEEYLEKKQKRVQDPFFRKTSFKGSGIPDISENHDEYLYGNK